MKGKAAAIACLLILAGAWLYIHAQPSAGPSLPTGPNGRYQIMEEDIDLSSFGGIQAKTALRIDSQTGQAWYMVAAPVSGGGAGRTLVWIPISEAK